MNGLKISEETTRQVEQEYFSNPYFGDEILGRMEENHRKVYDFVSGLTFASENLMENMLTITTGAVVYRAIEIQAEKQGIFLPSISKDSLKSIGNILNNENKLNLAKEMIEESPELTDLIEKLIDQSGLPYSTTASYARFGLHEMFKI